MRLRNTATVRPSVWRRAHERAGRLLATDARPELFGAAVGLGVLFGCSSFFGFQLLLALAIAVPLRLNKVAVAIGTQISTPPLTPIIVFAGANLGELMLHRRLLPLTLAEIRAMPARQLAERFLWAWTVGGLALGAVLGVIIGGAITLTVRSRIARRVSQTEF